MSPRELGRLRRAEMYSYRTNLAVLALWLATMSWLVSQKILPGLLRGEPPNYRSILEAGRDNPAVGWDLAIKKRVPGTDDSAGKQRRVGWAITTTEPLATDVTAIRSRVHFDEVPLEELTPGLLRSLGRLLEQSISWGPMDVESTVVIDPLGRLLSFDSVVAVDPLTQKIKVQGSVEGADLKLSVRSGQFQRETSLRLPSDALLGGTFSPQTHLPGLRRGQSWTVPVCNPLSPQDPVDVLQATVEYLEPFCWQGQTEEVWVVVYRGNPGSGPGREQQPRARLWVRRDGTVLRQEVAVLDATMIFQRWPDSKTAKLAQRLIKSPEPTLVAPTSNAALEGADKQNEGPGRESTINESPGRKSAVPGDYRSSQDQQRWLGPKTRSRPAFAARPGELPVRR